MIAICHLALALMLVHPAPHKTRNVFLIMTDGLRWQEVFGGADPELMKDAKQTDLHYKAFWRATPTEGREALMPFMWSVITKRGQIYGNRNLHSDSRVTNGRNFSYPGYSETLCGFPDNRIDSNAAVPNANVTVFEWLDHKPAFKGKVAAVANWNIIPWIFNRDRAGFFIQGGSEPLKLRRPTAEVKLLNRLFAEVDHPRSPDPADAMTYYAAVEVLKALHPRAFYLMFGETDDMAHSGNYARYLAAAHRVDEWLRELWQLVQSMPQYKDKTTFIITCDHGRGDAPTGWQSHGANVKGSEYTWIAVIGPDTAALGERHDCPTVTNSQIAATLAALLGEEYHSAVPKSGAPIEAVLGK